MLSIFHAGDGKYSSYSQLLLQIYFTGLRNVTSELRNRSITTEPITVFYVSPNYPPKTKGNYKLHP